MHIWAVRDNFFVAREATKKSNTLIHPDSSLKVPRWLRGEGGSLTDASRGSNPSAVNYFSSRISDQRSGKSLETVRWTVTTYGSSVAQRHKGRVSDAMQGGTCSFLDPLEVKGKQWTVDVIREWKILVWDDFLWHCLLIMRQHPTLKNGWLFAQTQWAGNLLFKEHPFSSREFKKRRRRSSSKIGSVREN